MTEMLGERSAAAPADEPADSLPAEHGPSVVRRRGTSPVRTVLLYLVTLWAVVTVVFLLPRLIPGDPLQALDQPDSGTFVYDPVIRAKVAAYYGLDKPLVTQYRSYVVGLAHGDLGWSISHNAPVTTLLRRRLPWTALLVGGALLVSSVVGFFAGVAAAWKRGKVLDRALIVSLSAARSIPEYAMAALLLVLFAVTFPLLPQAGATTAFASYPTVFDAIGDVIRHLVLPLTALSLGLLANQFLIVRNTAIGTLGEDYMLLARAKGLPPRLLKYRHSGRNALLPFLTALGALAGIAVGPSLFVEVVFTYPGMGSLLSGAVTARDYPLLQGGFVALAVAVLLLNLALDLLYGHLDPRAAR
ncbi:MAG: ABC transporter permease [Actinomycetota bacterium]|nr:ABC transporter permease [Actinomycetota bacterium]